MRTTRVGVLDDQKILKVWQTTTLHLWEGRKNYKCLTPLVWVPIFSSVTACLKLDLILEGVHKVSLSLSSYWIYQNIRNKNCQFTLAFSILEVYCPCKVPLPAIKLLCANLCPKCSANPITVTPIWKLEFVNKEHPIRDLYMTFLEKFLFKCQMG